MLFGFFQNFYLETRTNLNVRNLSDLDLKFVTVIPPENAGVETDLVLESSSTNPPGNVDVDIGLDLDR